MVRIAVFEQDDATNTEEEHKDDHQHPEQENAVETGRERPHNEFQVANPGQILQHAQQPQQVERAE